MPLINSVELVDRNNRPSVASRVMLRTYFVNDGVYQDPYQISSVHIFKREQNLSASGVLNTDGLVASGSIADAAMVFGVSADSSGIVSLGDGSAFASGNYTGELGGDGSLANPFNCDGVSGIYKLGTGDFFCVLDGVLASSLSGVDQPGTPASSIIKNTAEQAVRYIDIWTVKFSQGSAWKTYINQFELFDDTVFTLTEPLMLRSSNRLFNRYVTAGSKTDIKIGTELTVENQNIDESIKNIFKQSAVTSATVVITKHNEDPSLPSRVNVVSSTDVSITSVNTMIYTFDTNSVFSSANTNLNLNELGSRNGTYSVQVTYNLVNEKIVTPLMYFIVK